MSNILKGLTEGHEDHHLFPDYMQKILKKHEQSPEEKAMWAKKAADARANAPAAKPSKPKSDPYIDYTDDYTTWKQGQNENVQVDELSNDTLAKYKTAAAADAKKADSKGDYKRGDKRFSGIVKATKKQFANDEKDVDETKLSTMRNYYAGDKDAKDSTKLSQMRDYFSKVDSSKLAKNSRTGAAIRHTDKKQAEKQGVAEGYHHSKTIITEALVTQKLWENAGKKLVEAQLTADQINQIFQQVQQGATAAGGNRTMLGKGKDAASAVNKAWEDLKTKVQNSGPIKGVDAMYDKAAEQLKQATGGDQGVMKYVQKYRDFAKKHPIAQSLIYSALIAAAGISGAGLGGAAALGLFKMVDKLLQGEKFSSATYQGAKTGAMAYGASKLADYMKGKPEGGASGGGTSSGEVPPDIQQGLAADQAFQDSMLKKFPTTDGYTYSASGDSLQVFDSTGRKVFMGDVPLKTMDMKQFADLTNNGQMATPGISSGSISSDPMAGVSNAARSVAGTGYNAFKDPAVMKSLSDAAASGGRKAVLAQLNQIIPAADENFKEMMIDQAMRKSGLKESVSLSESQLYLVIGKIVERQRKLDEGIMDTIKGAAGKAVDWAKTKGTNLTTKVTADKLLQAWKKAGSPTDSLDVAKIIQNAGVPSDTIKQVYGSMKIPFAGEPGGGAMPQAAPKAGAAPQAAQPAAKAAPQAVQPVAKAGTAPQVAQPVTKAAVPQAVAKAAPQAVQPVAKAGTVPGYNAANVMKLPGMEKYAKPAPAKTANFGGGPTGYASVNTTFKQPTVAPAKQPTVAPAKQPTMAEEDLDENLHKWFKEKWVRFGPDGKIRGDCARGDDSEGKPKCLPQSKAHSLGKKGRASAASRKRREDPNPERSGKAINVNTKKKTNEAELDEACWKGYHKEGNKKMFGKTYPNCVKNTNESEEGDLYAMALQRYPQLKRVDRETVVNALNGAYEDYLMHYGYEGIGPDEESSLIDHAVRSLKEGVAEAHHSESCPHCGGEMVSEELMNEKKDACYYKVKSRYKVWPSAYASGALVKCRKSGADSWGNGGKKNESVAEGEVKQFPKKHRGDLEDTHSCVKCGGDLQGGTYMGHKVKVCMPCKQVYLPPNTGIDQRGNKVDEQGVAEGFSNDMSTEDMIVYLRQHHDKNLHQDYLDHLTSTNSKFVLKNIPINSIRTELSGLDRAKVEQYKKMDFNKAPPIVVGSDGNILDGYHRATVAKALGIPTIKAYVGVKSQQGVAEDQLDEKWTKKYKDSINCSNPKGFSQKAHCAGKQKNESAIMKGLKL